MSDAVLTNGVLLLLLSVVLEEGARTPDDVRTLTGLRLPPIWAAINAAANARLLRVGAIVPGDLLITESGIRHLSEARADLEPGRMEERPAGNGEDF